MRTPLLLCCLGLAVAFDPIVNQLSLNLSMAAYCAIDHVTSWNCSYCTNIPLEKVITFSNSSDYTFGYAGYHSARNEVWVSFRGTMPDSIKNWILNLDGTKHTLYSNVPGAKVDSGFFDGYESLISRVSKAVDSLHDAYNPSGVWVTGHSLGAAIAELTALDLSRHYAIAGVYNYGCPRVGNANFSAFYDAQIPNTWRVVYNDDVVPHLPWRLLGYHHVATEVWIHPEGGSYHVCNGSGEDPKCSDSVPPYDLSIRDHSSYAPGEGLDC